MSDDRHYVEQLENKVETMTKENNMLRQDLMDITPDATALEWAFEQMNIGLARAKAAELRVIQLEKELGRRKVTQTVQEAPASPKQLLVEDEPKPKPREVQTITPDLMGDLGDLLGYPKEGR